MAKNQNTYEKRRREVEKKRKAEEKRLNRRKKKETPDIATNGYAHDSRDEHETPDS